MKNSIKCAIFFALGLGTGAFGGYKYFELKLMRDLEKMDTTDNAAVVEPPKEEEKAEVVETVIEPYVSQSEEPSERTQYATKMKDKNPKKEEELFVEKGAPSDSDIDIIPAEDFGMAKEIPEVIYLTLYTDGVIADETGKVYPHPQAYIGVDAYLELVNTDDNGNYIGEETVCVRNFSFKTDYKIDRVDKPYYSESFLENDETLDDDED